MSGFPSIHPAGLDVRIATDRSAAERSPAIASFASLLPAAREQSEASEVRTAAAQLVSSAFVLPILEELRNTAAAVGAFAPGPAEKSFGPLLDREIADRVVNAAQFSLVDAVVRRIESSVSAGRMVDHVA